MLQYPTYCSEAASGSGAASSIRGVMPGVANPLADLSNEIVSLHLQTITDSISGRQFLGIATGYADRAAANNRGVVFIDVTGPWR